MNRKILAPKLVSCPIRGVIDIRRVLPVIETPEFQSLRNKAQLGLTNLIYPSATHSRMAHSFGAYDSAKELCWWLEDRDLITKAEAKAVSLYGLIHDIGHWALSHVTEPFFPISHDDNGRNIICNLKEQIEKCGVDFELVKSLANHTNKLYLLVHDKNLGMEKLDYLERDGRSTITDRPPGINYLRPHIYWIHGENSEDGQIVIDEKAIDVSKDVQDFYAKMFKNVYLRKCSVIAQRHFQKTVNLHLLSGGLTLSELDQMDDYDLKGSLGMARDIRVQALFTALKRRDLFREGVVLRYDDFVHAERTANKKISVIGLSNDIMEKIAASPSFSDRNQQSLLHMEEMIAKAIGLEQDDILVVTIVSPDRFRTQDISILTSGGEVASLRERYPNHFLDLGETAKAYTALRICSKNKNRDKLAKNADLIKDIILETLR